jgi:hypothetical protein
MRGSFVFTLDRVQAYGIVVVHAGGVRLRVPTPEWDALAVEEGQTVRLEVPEAVDRRLLVGSVTRLETGNTWACLCPPLRDGT